MLPLIHDSKYLRVWTVSAALRALLPDDSQVPSHDSDDDIDTSFKHGLRYVTCKSCDWHIDWASIFINIVMRGEGTLYISKETTTQTETSIFDEPAEGVPIQRVKLRPGMIFQFWPMCQHRVTTRRSMSLLSEDYESRYRGAASRSDVNPFKGLLSRRDCEQKMMNYIRRHRRKAA